MKRKGGFENIKNQDKKHHLAYENGKGKFGLKPDIVIDDGRIIIDTKWKILSNDKTNQGISQSDMYQLYAYGEKYKSENLYLIYPKDEVINGNLYHYYEDKKLPLQVLFFDVEKLENNENLLNKQ